MSLVYFLKSHPWRRARPRSRHMPSSFTNVKLGEALGTFLAGHISFTFAGIVRSAATPPPDRPAPDQVTGPRQGELAEVITAMYSGGGMDPSACTNDVTFTDPAAACCGMPEVVEAFRALSASCRPEHVEPPLAVREQQRGSGFEHEYHLHQRYFRSKWWQGLEVRSSLVVQTGADGRIHAIEERWNGAPLLWWAPFRWARRVNGVLSSLVMPKLAR